MAAADRPPVPVVVIGGYLGSGKTTLVNHLLRSGTGRRTLVLVNDFGEIAIDAELVVARDGETVALANGCVCCGIQGSLAETLMAIRERDEPPELLVIEASGVADPARIADHAAIPGFTLDAVVVVVDAETVEQRAADPVVGRTVERQLAAADVLVCNKVDLVEPGRLPTLRTWLADRAPGAAIVTAEQAVVPLEFVIGTGPHLARGAPGAEEDHGHATWAWRSEVPLERHRLETLLAYLPHGVVRMKGVLDLADTPEHRTVLQVVGDRVVISRGAPWGEETPYSALVAVGLPDSLADNDLERALTDDERSLPEPAVLLRTSRLRIRRFDAGDVETFHAYRNDPDIARHQGWDLPWSHDDSVMFVAEMALRDPLFERGEWAQLAIERRKEPGLVGDIGVLWQADDDVAEIGFTLAPGFQGQGYMTEALAAVCDEVAEALGLRLVAAVVHGENARSRAVLDRVGFAAVALDGDEIVYAWKPGGWPEPA